MAAPVTYAATRDRVETYFDRTATDAWARLTSDAPVSRIRETVRRGRDRMREMILARLTDGLPDDLTGARILDAGCGAGQLTAELARRGADVVAVDISPQLVGIARARLPAALSGRVDFVTGDMLDDGLGRFDAAVAMDSLIYYRTPDLAAALESMAGRAERIVFTAAPRTPLLMAMWAAGRAFPRGDRSPVMVPQSAARLAPALTGRLAVVGSVRSGFYLSDCLEYAR